MMPTGQQYRSLARTDEAGSISAPVNHEDYAITADNYCGETESARLGDNLFAPDRMFLHASEARITLSERFPRLAIAAVAFALFCATVSTEIDYLHGAGYHWR
jgi:hypothetical protein